MAHKLVPLLRPQVVRVAAAVVVPVRTVVPVAVLVRAVRVVVVVVVQ